MARPSTELHIRKIREKAEPDPGFEITDKRNLADIKFYRINNSNIGRCSQGKTNKEDPLPKCEIALTISWQDNCKRGCFSV